MKTRGRFGASMLLCVVLLAGCVSYDGRGLVPGRSTAAEVEAQMGRPAEKQAGASGESTWFYARGGEGRETYAVVLGPNGVVRSVEQRLTKANIAKLVPGASTERDVRALFGPPHESTRLPRQQRQVWTYRMLDHPDPRVMWVQFSGDGVMREVFEGHDFTKDPPIGDSRD